MALKPQNNSRASELGDVLLEGAQGFTRRKTTGAGRFFQLFLLSSMIMMGSILLAYYHSLVGCLLIIALGISFAIVAENLEKHRKAKEALEFMNALFSSAIGKGYRCCFIVKFSGEIVFYNRPFQAIFTDYVSQSTRTLQTLLALYDVPEADREALQQLLASNAAGTVTTRLRSGTADSTLIAFEVEPIERPTGFFLIRGK